MTQEQQNHASTGNEYAITTELSWSTETQDFMKKTEQHTDLEQTKPCKTLSQEMVCKGPPSLLTYFSQKKKQAAELVPPPLSLSP